LLTCAWISRGQEQYDRNPCDVLLGIFCHLLFHLCWDDLKCHAKEIIDTANSNRYRVVDLNLEAEACLVVGNKVKVNNKISFNDAPWGTDGDGGWTELIAMRIIKLRQKAHKNRGLNVNGSMKMLIATLKED